MKFIKYIIPALAALALASCSGQTDSEEYDLSLRPDNTEIYADGLQSVSFTVSYGPVDVSKSKDMFLAYEKDGKRTELQAGKNSFSTTEAGTYIFQAFYDNGQKTLSSASVTISAQEPEKIELRYYKKMLAMEFTSIHCTYCPILAETVKNIEKAYPGRLIPAAFHCDNMGTDPMSVPLNGKFYENVVIDDNRGLPHFAFDMRKSSERDIVNEYSLIESELKTQMENYPAVGGVAITSTYDKNGGKIDVKAMFKADVRGEYRCHVFLVEDGIEHTQAGYEGTAPYVHDNVVRAIASDNVFGTKLNQGKALEADTEYTYSKSFTVGEGWNVEKMRVIACLMKADSDGSIHMNNSNVCAVGSKVEYLINE